MSEYQIDWYALPMDQFAGIVEDDRILLKQLDEQGTPSTSVRLSIAMRERIYKERLEAHR